MPESAISSQPSLNENQTVAQPRSFFLYFAILLGVVIFFGVIRWRLADVPLERDEGEYAYAGQLILDGVPPYQLAYNMKLPGTYAAYAAILAVFGQTSHGIHIGLLLVNGVSTILLFFLVNRLFGPLAGLVAGASYALLSTHQSVLGFAAHATHFMVLGVLAGMTLLLRAEETGRTAFFFLSGLAFGFVFIFKQPGGIFAAFGFLYLAISCWPPNPREWRALSIKLGLFAFGVVLPFAITCLLLYKAGVFSTFWFWTFTYARQYGSRVKLRDGSGQLVTTFSYMFHKVPGLWLMALTGLTAFLWDNTLRRHAFLVIGLLVPPIVAVSAGFYFRPHYFIVALPVVAILIGISVIAMLHLIEAMRTVSWMRVVPLAVFAAAWLTGIFVNADVYFKLNPFQVSRAFYRANPFNESLSVAEYVKQHTSPNDKIMVFGSEPQIYFYAHRKSASGFIYTYSLMEDQAYWQPMQQQLIREVEANRPAYVVFVAMSYSWLARPQSPQPAAFFPWMDQYLRNGYEQVGVAQIGRFESQYFWDDQLKTRRVQPGLEIQVFKRKS